MLLLPTPGALLSGKRVENDGKGRAEDALLAGAISNSVSLSVGEASKHHWIIPIIALEWLL